MGPGRNPFRERGARVIEMNASNQFNAMVQLDKQGKSLQTIINVVGELYFAQHLDPQPFGNEEVSSIPLDRAKGVKRLRAEPRTMTFTKRGDEFLLFSGKVLHSLFPLLTFSVSLKFIVLNPCGETKSLYEIIQPIFPYKYFEGKA